MRTCLRNMLLVTAITAVIVLVQVGAAGAMQPKIEGRSPDFVMKANMRGGPFSLKGDFVITWEDYSITGTLGEGDSTKGFLKVTRDPHLTQSGDNPLELFSDVLELETTGSRITANGNVRIKAKNMDVATNHLEGGLPDKMLPIANEALQSMAEPVRAEVVAWLKEAKEKDQIFLLQGAVAGTTPEVNFKGGILLLNATAEVFIFAGPAEITYLETAQDTTATP